MPPHIKLGLSAMVLVAAYLAHVFRDTIGLQASGLFLGVFAVFMVAALWAFPEPRKEKLPRK
jgi:hypothetical protein